MNAIGLKFAPDHSTSPCPAKIISFQCRMSPAVRFRMGTPASFSFSSSGPFAGYVRFARTSINIRIGTPRALALINSWTIRVSLKNQTPTSMPTRSFFINETR